MTKKQKKMLLRILLTSVLLALLIVCPFPLMISIPLGSVALLVIGYDVFLKMLKNLSHFKPMDEHFLMTVASVGAFVLGEVNESVAVLLFYQVGEWFESIAVAKSRKNIADMMDICPPVAMMVVDGKEIETPVEEVPAGSMIVVRPGEKIPLDGVVLKGYSEIDTSSLTGESLPTYVEKGTTVLAASMVVNGELFIQTTCRSTDTKASRIVALMEETSMKKAKKEKFISSFARIYTPVVCSLALCLAVLPPLLIGLFYGEWTFSTWIYRALSFLVVSCPCALVVSVPLSYFSAFGALGKRGILIKGAEYLETVSQVKNVVFDKTGTLTDGHMMVSDVRVADRVDHDEFLSLLVSLEKASTHPLAISVCSAFPKTPVLPLNAVSEIPGFGVVGVLDGKTVLCGNDKLLEKYNVSIDITVNKTAVHLVRDGQYLGTVSFEDEVKTEASSVIQKLKKLGVLFTAMLSGDRNEKAKSVAQKIGLDDSLGELLPADKVTALNDLMQHRDGKTLYMGDGLNDAPVLSCADVGVSMHGIGSDAALECADVVFMDGDLNKLPVLFTVAKKTRRIVNENIIFAIGIKVACLILASLGIASMGVAIFADVGVLILCILNAMRNFMMR